MQNKKSSQRYAFIDVQNTASTTRQLLGFLINWNKLGAYLKDAWKCKKVYFYSGIDEGDTETVKEFDSLAINGCIVKTKTIYSYKKPDKTVVIKCIKCGADNAEVVNMGYNRKSNCDVDLTVDAMEEAGSDKEFLIFTGDGDFDYLIRKVLEKGTKVYVVSSNAGIKKPGMNTRRLSTKLKDVIKEHPKEVHLINIDSWKMRIQKSV